MTRTRSWRFFVGGVLILLGILLLLAALGAFSFGTAWGVFWALFFIFIGVLILWRPRYQHAQQAGSPRVTVGDVRIGDREWDLHDMETGMAAGQLRLDLRKARIPQGETRVAVSGGVGKIEVLVPAGLPISVQVEVGAGSINILGQRADGVGRQLAFTSPGYDSAEKKVKMELSLMMGEAIVASAG